MCVEVCVCGGGWVKSGVSDGVCVCGGLVESCVSRCVGSGARVCEVLVVG